MVHQEPTASGPGVLGRSCAWAYRVPACSAAVPGSQSRVCRRHRHVADISRTRQAIASVGMAKSPEWRSVRTDPVSRPISMQPR